jgi:Zn-finger nucleic acid-binding protein
MKCPNCTGTLKPINYKRVNVDKCDSCHGIWFDFSEIDQLEDTEFAFDNLKNTMITRVKPGDQKCAKCQATMQKFYYRWEELELEVCPSNHGFWLDAGEEEKLLTFIDKFEKDLYVKLVGEEDWERRKRNMKSDSWLAELMFTVRDRLNMEKDVIKDNINNVINDLK